MRREKSQSGGSFLLFQTCRRLYIQAELRKKAEGKILSVKEWGEKAVRQLLRPFRVSSTSLLLWQSVSQRLFAKPPTFVRKYRYFRRTFVPSYKVPSYDMILSCGSTKVRKYLRTFEGTTTVHYSISVFYLRTRASGSTTSVLYCTRSPTRTCTCTT